MNILVPHGTTPTMIGMIQQDNGDLRPTSPCCGWPMSWSASFITLLCDNCNKDQTACSRRVEPFTIGNDVESTTDEDVLLPWLQGIFGTDDVTLEVDKV